MLNPKSFQSIKSSLEMEGLKLTEREEKLVMESIEKKISHSEFLTGSIG
ncbi:hypothetical protein [Halalkalibacter hemicellulosilyticus]|nr:hypothetical protein [Halalkalibacter hemicellulosilyticus]